GTDEEALHLADAALELAQGCAAGRLPINARDENQFVPLVEMLQLVVEILKGQIDSQRGRIVEDEVADQDEVAGRLDDDRGHTDSSPRSTVPAWPPRRTRSPASVRRSVPPRRDA